MSPAGGVLRVVCVACVCVCGCRGWAWRGCWEPCHRFWIGKASSGPALQATLLHVHVEVACGLLTALPPGQPHLRVLQIVAGLSGPLTSVKPPALGQWQGTGRGGRGWGAVLLPWAWWGKGGGPGVGSECTMHVWCPPCHRRHLMLLTPPHALSDIFYKRAKLRGLCQE